MEPVLEPDVEPEFGFVVVLPGVLLACFYGRGVVRVLEGTQNVGADLQLLPQHYSS